MLYPHLQRTALSARDRIPESRKIWNMDVRFFIDTVITSKPHVASKGT
jgi:hypothetical protein